MAPSNASSGCNSAIEAAVAAAAAAAAACDSRIRPQDGPDGVAKAGRPEPHVWRSVAIGSGRTCSDWRLVEGCAITISSTADKA